MGTLRQYRWKMRQHRQLQSAIKDAGIPRGEEIFYLKKWTDVGDRVIPDRSEQDEKIQDDLDKLKTRIKKMKGDHKEKQKLWQKRKTADWIDLHYVKHGGAKADRQFEHKASSRKEFLHKSPNRHRTRHKRSK